MYTIRRFNIDGETYLNAKDVIQFVVDALVWLPNTQEQAVEIEKYIHQDLFDECENEHLVEEYKKVFWDWKEHT